MDTIDLPSRCHDDTFSLPPDLIAELRQQHLFIRKQRIAWLAKVAMAVYPLVLEIEDEFRRYCIESGIARCGRTATMLLRFLCGQIDKKTVTRWADVICYVYEHLADTTAAERRAAALIEETGGIVSTHEAYRAEHQGFDNDAADSSAERSASAEAGQGPEEIVVAPLGRRHHDFRAKTGSTNEWWTPEEIFVALDCRFDTDPASPGREYVPWIPVTRHFVEDGLDCEWEGFVWLNPPYGKDQIDAWLDKFAEHGNGVALVPERAYTVWWQNLARDANLILVLNRKLTFMTPKGRHHHEAPIGTHLVAYGEKGVRALINAYQRGMGLLLTPFFPPLTA